MEEERRSRGASPHAIDEMLPTALSLNAAVGRRDDAARIAAVFGLDNLPYGAVARPGEPAWLAARYEDKALPLAPLEGDLPPGTLSGPTLNPLLALGRPAWSALRRRVREAIEAGAALTPLGDLEARLPIAIGDYVDFYSSLEHATNLGRMFRPDTDPLLPNWRHLPVGYHGRASSVVVSGTPVHRPHGQLPTQDGPPTFGPTQRLDIELELGFVTGPGNDLGMPITTAEAPDHVFGFVLVNDWSARDIQRWEYQPLGPFLGKSFATSISPWVTPLEALDRYRVPARPQDPRPLPYLETTGDWALDIDLEVELNGEVISRTNARGLYWTFPQQLAHATVNGTNVRPGDLYASGTISGSEPGSQGSFIELQRPFLQDGDTVVLRGRAGDLSLGEVAGTIVP
jgi:fumarylacetoacetase